MRRFYVTLQDEQGKTVVYEADVELAPPYPDLVNFEDRVYVRSAVSESRMIFRASVGALCLERAGTGGVVWEH